MGSALAKWTEASVVADRIATGRLDYDIANCVLEQFGGVEGLGRELKLEYDATPNPKDKLRVLCVLLKFFSKVSDGMAMESTTLSAGEIQAQLDAIERQIDELNGRRTTIRMPSAEELAGIKVPTKATIEGGIA